MNVILQKTTAHLGMVGDIVNVAPGYYRNYLGPRQIALLADPGNVRQWEHHKKIVEAKKAKEKGAALALKEKLESTPVKITHAAGMGEKLFGSITSQDIAIALREAGFSIGRKFILLESPIKTTGKHGISIKLHPEVLAELALEVAPKEGVKAEAAESVKESKKAKGPKKEKTPRKKVEAKGEAPEEEPPKATKTTDKKTKGHKPAKKK